MISEISNTHADGPAAQRVVASTTDFNTTVERLEAAIRAAGLLVIQEINTQERLAKAGIAVAGTRQIFIFHPRYAKRIAESNPRAAIEAPLRILVLEKGSGAEVVYYDPRDVFGAYEHLAPLGEELAGIMEKIAGAVNTVTQSTIGGS